MNHLSALTVLGNAYFVMRHGHSLANAAGIIVSHPEHGCSGYGLSESGRDQVRGSLRAQQLLGADTLLLSSDFRRALDSAEIAHRLLGCRQPLRVDARLRERFFGAYDMGDDSAYSEIWRHDEVDPDSRLGGIESANQVMARVTELIVELEAAQRGQNILLVSHGDALQLLQTAFRKQAASSHRLLDHLHTAEIRRLDFADAPEL